MTRFILRIFDFLRLHRWVAAVLWLVPTLLLVWQVLKLNYKEDILAFLPLDEERQNAMQVFQDISGADRLMVLVQMRDTSETDPDQVVEAIDLLVAHIEQNDSTNMVRDLIAQMDIEQMQQTVDFVCSNVPYFMQESDYNRIDSLLQQPQYVAEQLQRDKQMLLFPSSNMVAQNIERDPLGLFSSVLARMQRASSANYELYDGYIFAPDMSRALVMMSSPFGSSETSGNTRLLKFLNDCIDSMQQEMPQVVAHVIGGPSIAVGNSQQIKTDSIISVALAALLILLLLFFAFRRWRPMLLIVISISWGWIFALGTLAMIHDGISLIVVGISSVIIGIAVNYPLHLMAHLSRTPDVRMALKEIVVPLVVGNITTVGAFLCLVPLDSVALRDLGLFSAFLLVGTILFVILFLPHLVGNNYKPQREPFARVGEWRLERKRWVVEVVLVLTIVFGYFSTRTSFDSNMSHINYMTAQQREDMAFLQEVMSQPTTEQSVYVVSTDTSLDAALNRSLQTQPLLQQLVQSGTVVSSTGCAPMLASQQEQKQRLQRWNNFVERYGGDLVRQLRNESSKQGFSENSFDGFYALIGNQYTPQPQSYFAPLYGTLFASNTSCDSVRQKYNVVDVLTVSADSLAKVESIITRETESYAFDVRSLNSTIATNLSNDFNYIGWACGLIVFFFLWFSLGSLELALLSFLPMAVSWLWILGLMSLLGIQFNIVNVILATFIFGQGDDYTIFMTEGCTYEYAYRRKMLASYKNSIILSALIMFVGIGTLIFAKHPALRSLAEVTIVGMSSVVLMAFVLPPLVFDVLVRYRGAYRFRPLTISALSRRCWLSVVQSLCHINVFMSSLFVLHKNGKYRYGLQRMAQRVLKSLPSVSLKIDDKGFIGPSCVILCCSDSPLAPFVVWAVSHRTVIIENENHKVWRNMARRARASLRSEQYDEMRKAVEVGCCFVVIDSDIDRGAEETQRLAKKLNIPMAAMVLHGADHVLPAHSSMLYAGTISCKIMQDAPMDGIDTPTRAERSILFHSDNVALANAYRKTLQSIAQNVETIDYFKPLVMDRYRYKGVEVVSSVRRSLRRIDEASLQALIVEISADEVVMHDPSCGENAMIYALTHPEQKVLLRCGDESIADLARYAIQGVVSNIRIETTTTNGVSAQPIVETT